MTDSPYSVSPHGQVVQDDIREDGTIMRLLLSHAMPLQQAEAIASLLNWCAARRDAETAEALLQSTYKNLPIPS